MSRTYDTLKSCGRADVIDDPSELVCGCVIRRPRPSLGKPSYMVLLFKPTGHDPRYAISALFDGPRTMNAALPDGKHYWDHHTADRGEAERVWDDWVERLAAAADAEWAEGRQQPIW
ncbi:hypothetical protein [Azospirillum sp. SYSU D00513]|uniref:hypothetical protein n=1 Tax=Azospirillum sp. SYSU D00513 TaxID=2812561 RepID=UPI001A95A623|nr:hypothetical protein [Azospirillum sp. SYSU D00513]